MNSQGGVNQRLVSIVKAQGNQTNRDEHQQASIDAMVARGRISASFRCPVRSITLVNNSPSQKPLMVRRV